MVQYKLRFVPQWDGPIVGWSKNYIRKNQWRMDYLYEFEDLLQEAYIKFLHCKFKYPKVIEPKHFMSLYQSSLINHFNNLSNKSKYRNRFVALQSESDPHENYLHQQKLSVKLKQPTENSYGDVAVLLSNAPLPIKKLINAFLDNDKIFEFRKISRRTKCGHTTLSDGGMGIRETTNQKYCRIIGCDPSKINIVKAVRYYFGVI